MERNRTGWPIYLILVFLLFMGCNRLNKGWYDNGNMYVCPDCANHPYLQLGDTCERCGRTIPVNPMVYCYSCAKELNSCQCCEVER